MKRYHIFLLLSIIGFILPNILVVQESLESGNFLLYADPVATFSAMFANRISSIFAIDLLFVTLVFFGWSFALTSAHHRTRLLGIWAATMAFGLAFGFPFFWWWQAHVRESR
ncbi:MAG: DUF2834 domain-containing protein [Salibacteraceae bacterium]